MTATDASNNSHTCTSIVTFPTGGGGMSISINGVSANEGENDPLGGPGLGGTLTFELTISGGTGAMSVDYATVQ